jgi:hypothetical protein
VTASSSEVYFSSSVVAGITKRKNFDSILFINAYLHPTISSLFVLVTFIVHDRSERSLVSIGE